MRKLWNRYFAGVRFFELVTIAALAFHLVLQQSKGGLRERLIMASLWAAFISIIYLRVPKSGDFLIVSGLSLVNPVLGRVVASALGVDAGALDINPDLAAKSVSEAERPSSGGAQI